MINRAGRKYGSLRAVHPTVYHGVGGWDCLCLKCGMVFIKEEAIAAQKQKLKCPTCVTTVGNTAPKKEFKYIKTAAALNEENEKSGSWARRIPQELIDKIFRMIEKTDMTDREIANELGVSISTVKRRRNGTIENKAKDIRRARNLLNQIIPLPKELYRKVPEMDVRTIRRLHAKGCTMTAIADAYQLSQGIVSNIILCKTYKHVI